MSEAGGKGACASVTDLETDIGNAERGCQEQLARRLQPECGKKFARRNADQPPKDTIEMEGAEASNRGHILKRQLLVQVSVHRLDGAFHGMNVGCIGDLRAAFSESRWRW